MKMYMSKSAAETVAQSSSKMVNPCGLDWTGQWSRGLAGGHRGDFLVPVFSSPKKQVWGSCIGSWGSRRLWHDSENSSIAQVTPEEEKPQESGVSLGQGKHLQRIQRTLSFHLPSKKPRGECGTPERAGKGRAHAACLNSPFNDGRLEGDGNSLRKVYENEQEEEVRDGESPQKGAEG